MCAARGVRSRRLVSGWLVLVGLGWGPLMFWKPAQGSGDETFDETWVMKLLMKLCFIAVYEVFGTFWAKLGDETFDETRPFLMNAAFKLNIFSCRSVNSMLTRK